MSSSEMSSFVSVTGMNLPVDMGFATFFKHVYEQRLNTDVDFDLLGPDGNVTFSAHKMVLSLWSPYFADKFFYEKKKMDNVVNILQYTNVNPEAFEAMLRFMYGCSPCLQDSKKACELYKVAIKFEVSSLQKTCRQFLNELKVETSNVFEILDASKYMGNKSRSDVCLKLIQERIKEVMKAYDLSGTSPSMLQIYLDLPKMCLSGEYELIEWVFSWAKTKYEESNKYSNIREVLEPFLSKLNFLALSNKDFATLCSKWPNFFTDDEIIRIFMNLGVRGSRKMPDWFDENVPVRIYDESNTTEKTEADEN